MRRKLSFAELIIPKTTAFVGETIPAEIRLGIQHPGCLIGLIEARDAQRTGLHRPTNAESGADNWSQSMAVPMKFVTFKTAITAGPQRQARNRGQGRQGDRPNSTAHR